MYCFCINLFLPCLPDLALNPPCHDDEDDPAPLSGEALA
eukprot:CAMPEP_0172032208 /NCGR_PEP_ID=MMETSP1041-20130122/19743_1 /TAXON_ID=464988 /ORGANISM="Hemiselmis andersenii, Strain CCMP439" /LENGTH=38 /DNA_ID= /DNA_START= /DNA_END= /DNA_ORIENTATION=